MQVAQLSQAGRQFLSPGSIGVRLASLEARAALAVAGNAAEAAQALETADRAREAVREGDEDPGIFNFPVAKQYAYAGTTHLSIGGHRNVLKAIECAETAVTLYRRAADDDQSTGDLLAAHLDIARGHMLTGDIDATESLLGLVLDGGSGQLSASILARLDAVGRELGAPQYRGSSQVTQLRERIKSTATPAALPVADLSEPLT
jgi:hypothetical protein